MTGKGSRATCPSDEGGGEVLGREEKEGKGQVLKIKLGCSERKGGRAGR